MSKQVDVRTLEEVLHDLRTPLASAKGRAETLMKHWQGSSDQRKLHILAGVILGLNELEFAVDRLDPEPVRQERAQRRSRPQLVDLEVDDSSGSGAARVVLEHAGGRIQGVGEPSENDVVRHPAVARATVTALGELLTDELELLDAGVVQMGDTPFALVSLRRGNDVLVGAAVAESDLNVAIARATLDALNRVVTRPSN